MNIVSIAKVCHEANRALCAGLGDNSQLPWEDAPEWQRDSAYNGVIFNINNPDAPASASHDSWLEEKSFVPYEALPAEQQAKDHLFKATVAALAPLLTPTPECDVTEEPDH